MARIAARHKDRVNPRQFLENFSPFVERERHRGRLGILPIHRRIPNPDVETVLVRQPRHGNHHLHRRQWKVRTAGVVVRPRRNQLDGIAAEHDEVADVLFPSRHVPRVVRVGLGPVAELVAAQPVRRRRRDIEVVWKRDDARAHPQAAEQVTDPEQDASRIVADDEHGRSARDSFDANPITFGSRRLPIPCQFLRILSSKQTELRRRTDRDDRRWRRRPRQPVVPADVRPLFHFLDQHRDRFSEWTGQVRRTNHGCSAEVHGPGPRLKRQQHADPKNEGAPRRPNHHWSHEGPRTICRRDSLLDRGSPLRFFRARSDEPICLLSAH